MKPFILIASIILFPFFSFSQSYVPFPEDSAWWSVRIEANLGYLQQISYTYTNQYKMRGDTIVNGVSYNKIYYSRDSVFISPYDKLYCFLRQDTTLRTVYIKYPYEAGLDTTERLLYDFSLDTGDTFIINILYKMEGPYDSLVPTVPGDPEFDYTRYHTVSWFQTTKLLNDEERKTTMIAQGNGEPLGGGSCINLDFVEGIGSLGIGLFYIEIPYFGCENYSPNSFYFCFWYKGKYLYGGNDCFKNTISGINETSTINTLKIYPNPVTDIAYLRLPKNNAQLVSMEIYNILGKRIQYKEYFGGNYIYLYQQDFQPGIYYFKLINKKNSYTGSFVVY